MSLWATTATWDGSQAKGSALIVLLALGSYADEDGYCWPSITTLERMTRLSRRGVTKAIDSLVAFGEVARVKRGGVVDGKNKSTVYQIDIELLRGRAHSSPPVGNTATGGRELSSPKPSENHQTSFLPSVEKKNEAPSFRDDLQTVHSRFVAKCEPKQTKLTPSQERLIRKGLAECSVDACCQAIDGLVEYQKRRGGNLNLSRVFQTRPGGSPLGEQIEWWASQAPDAPASSGFTSDAAAEISKAKRAVIQAAAFPGNSMLQAQGEQAIQTLAAFGIQAEIRQMTSDPPTYRPFFIDSDEDGGGVTAA